MSDEDKPVVKECCATCDFGKAVPDARHINCRRYPNAVQKNASEWCGEYRAEKVDA